MINSPVGHGALAAPPDGLPEAVTARSGAAVVLTSTIASRTRPPAYSLVGDAGTPQMATRAATVVATAVRRG
jgi:hypothetical protein